MVESAFFVNLKYLKTDSIAVSYSLIVVYAIADGLTVLDKANSILLFSVWLHSVEEVS